MFKKLRDKAKNKKGFTLVELIVVIVIILVLAAVLVPSLLKYIDSANKANCKADAASLLTQVQADYAASQASTETEVTKVPEKIGVVSVSQVTAGNKLPDTTDKNTAQYTVTTGTNYTEVSGLVYNNGKYTAKWSDGTWTISKDPKN